ncbi:class I SAM-dependent RNA methyltransferase [Roseinatronobacter sp. HJB301]|uniref:Class I SAM-dependent RNA methyltransferase n=2 Tax=Roseinatronobacter alkalisoli TaxID=3028235 RepID=A0ABT5TBR5_9RHOB|nr:class I SAM-dependent RNA methyltransferase [Roseinatronobacter sp. HJB301]MDD7972565.1 class I SAM-dependent RNA methyltransferase [Roseinatronobacter sp. HJB301]
MNQTTFPIYLACLPGLEAVIAQEAHELGLPAPIIVPGGVETTGTWPDIWRANLWLRCASRVLVRLGQFRALHLAQLDKRARKFPWADFLRPDIPVRVDVTCTRSRIYHQKAAAQRIQTAITETLGASITLDADLRLMVRIDDDMVTVSLDTSGEGLHKRGHKLATGKAPLRETMAAAFLNQMGFDGTQPVIDPMCGSGTFILEAAERAAGLPPGRTRTFAFENLSSFEASAWAQMRQHSPQTPPAQFFGFDRDQGVIQNARENAQRAGLEDCTAFTCQPISALSRPDTPPGLIMVNPPYGGRIGNPARLFGLYATLGQVLRENFAGWRLGLVTSERKLAHATGLNLQPGPPIPHGGLKVQLFQSGPL